MHRHRPILLIGILALAGAACAGGEQGSPSPDTTPATQPSPVQTLPAESPGELPTGSPGESPTGSPAASPAESPTGSPAASPTGETITVTGVDYAFEGVPTSVPVGTTFGFDNQGTELHEMAVFRKNDDVTMSFEEILQLPDAEAFTMVTPVGQAFSAPGEMAEGEVNLAQEGEYILLCFIPQGTIELPTESPGTSPSAESPGASPAASPGPPHFVLGMLQQFQVTEAGSTPGPIASPMVPASPGTSPGTSPAISPDASP